MVRMHSCKQLQMYICSTVLMYVCQQLVCIRNKLKCRSELIYKLIEREMELRSGCIVGSEDIKNCKREMYDWLDTIRNNVFYHDNDNAIKLLLQKREYLNVCLIDESLILTWALELKKNRIVCCLLEMENVNVNLQGINGMYALHVAVSNTDLLTLDKLLNKGANIDCVDYLGRSVMHYAIEDSVAKMLLTLVNKGANVNHVDNDGNSALHYAVICCSIAKVVTLVTIGVDIFIKNKKGKIASDYATSKAVADEFEDLTAIELRIINQMNIVRYVGYDLFTKRDDDELNEIYNYLHETEERITCHGFKRALVDDVGDDDE